MHITKALKAVSRTNLTVSHFQRKLAAALLAGTSIVAIGFGIANAVPVTNPITPTTHNNGAGSVAVTGGTTDLTGTANFTGTVWFQYQFYQSHDAWVNNVLTGGSDPANYLQLQRGGQSFSVSVPDPLGAQSIRTYDNSVMTAQTDGSWFTLFSPTGTTTGTFVNARLADVSGGGTLNFNVSGTLGNPATKDTIFVKVTDGIVNWQSGNYLSYAPAQVSITPAAVVPRAFNLTYTVFAGTVTVNTSDGLQTHSVTDLASLRVFNTWLQQQAAAGKLGATQAATQAAYDAAFASAYSSATQPYTYNPTGGVTIPANDPLFWGQGQEFGLVADGVNAKGVITSTGSIMVRGGGAATLATNGGTITNNGTVISTSGSGGLLASRGGHVVNNGLRTIGITTKTGGVDPGGMVGYDGVYDSGSTYQNNGTINLAGWDWDRVTNYRFVALYVVGGGEATNAGTMNVGVTTHYGSGYLTGADVAGANSSFTNDTGGVMNLGRAQDGLTDVVQGSGGYVINAGGSASPVTVTNKGTINIGDLSQNATAIRSGGSNVVTVNSSGTINVGGHYSAVPGINSGIYSNNTNAGSLATNSGTINLTGLNVRGMQVIGGGQAASSGTINVAGSADIGSGLRSYGVWAEGAGSLVSLSAGAVNLKGDGAIGVHARDAGAIAISGTGAVTFADGTKQIGFYVLGPSAVLTNTSTGAMNVATEGSTLFRMEDGADFAGGIGAASLLTASGKNSTAVLVTGATGADVSAFNSGGMTMNLTGEGALGVLVEGGAQGKISSTANINLSGVGSIAGIADGQKHDLSGAAVGGNVTGVLSNSALDAGAAGFGTGTLLVSQAALTSSLDQVTGYIARNGASLDNSGNIVFTGSNTTGIRVEEGSTGANTGWITVQDGGVGLIAATSGAATVMNNTGVLTLKGGTNTNRTMGISATGSAVTVNMTAGIIDMQGQGAIGVAAYGGAKVNLTGTAVPNFSTNAAISDQIGFLISGVGSNITTSALTTLDAAGTRSTMFRVENGATQSGALQMYTSGSNARGIWATGDGTNVTAASGSDFQVTGANAMAVLVQGGAHVTLDAGTTVSLVGAGAIVGQVDGNEYGLDGTTVIRTNTDALLTNNATLTTPLSNAVGFITQNQGKLINNGAIDFTAGTNNIGVSVINGKFENHANISVNGIAVSVVGAGSVVDVQAGAIKATNGTAAIRVGNAATLNLTGSGIGTVTAGGTAHAVLVDTGAAGLIVGGAHIDMASAGVGTGNGIENKAELAGIQLTAGTIIDVANGKGVRTSAALANNNSGTINVIGTGTGLAFQTATGGASGNNVDLSLSSGLTINVTGASGAGTGISVNHTGNGDLNSAANVIVSAGGGSAVKLLGVSTFENAGNLTSASTANIVDLGVTKTVTNTGKIQAASAATAALTFDGQDSTLTNSGQITGIIDLGAGANIATNASGATITGTIVSATGNNTVTNSGTIVGDIALGDGINSTTLIGGSSVKQVTGGIGTNTVTVNGNAAFVKLDGGIGGGNDTLTFDGATHTLSAISDIDHFETIALKNSSVITTADPIKMTDTAGGVGAISIDATSTLNLRPTAGYTLNHAMTGTGTISAVMGSATGAFTFGAGAGNAFAGTLEMGTGTLALSGANTTALTNATLRLDSGSVTTVGTGTQTIKNLAFNSGTMVFDANVPADLVSPANVVTTGNLDISGAGTVKVTVPAGGFNNSQPLPTTSAPLLAQDDNTAMTRLIQSTGTVTGTGGALALVDQNGVAISSAKVLDITQNSTKVAEGTYDYRLMNSSDGVTANGLYVGYGLTQVNLIGAGTNALVLAPAASATGLATDLSAKIIGSGDLTIAAGVGKTVSLSNTLNSYTGVTTASTGTLRLDANNALGATSQLAISSGATTDINGKTQTIGALAGVSGSSLNLNAGTLTISNGGTSDGTLTGAGTMTLAGGNLAVNGGNSGLTAAVTINGPATATLTNVAGLGNSGTLTDNGTLVLSGASGTLAKAIAGTGVVNLVASADVVLSGTNTLSGSWNTATGTKLMASVAANLGTAAINNAGTFDVNSSTNWQLDNAVTGAGTFIKEGTGTLTIARANAMTGPANVTGGMLALTNADGVGSGLVTVGTATGSTTTGLNLVFATSQTFDNQLAGAGTSSVTGAGVATITGANSGYTGNWQITGSAAVANSATTSSANLGTGTVNIASGGTLAATTSGAFTFGNKLTGAGALTASNSNAAFAFGPTATVGTAFAGAAYMTNNTFALSGDNTAALTNARLVVGTNNVTTVGTGQQNINALAFSGGTAVFDATAPANKLANGWVNVSTLDLTGASGTVKITVPTTGFDNSQPLPSTVLSLMEQDDANVLLKLVSAGAVVNAGGASSLTLTDQNGNALSSNRIVDIEQAGVNVAKGIYDYGLTASANNDGLYVNYGLKQVELIGTLANALVLTPSASATGAATDLSAKVIGSGDLTIQAGAGNTLSLSNTGNTYTGITTADTGTLKLGGNNVLGLTSNLVVSATGVVDMNGKTQTVGEVNTALGGRLNITTGSTLTIADAQRSGSPDGGAVDHDTLFGGGTFVIDPSIVRINGTQLGFTGNIPVTGGSQLILNTANAFDNALNIELVGATDKLTFGDLSSYNPLWTAIPNGSAAVTLKGLGVVETRDTSDVTLTGDNSAFAGTFDVGTGSALRGSEAKNLGTAAIIANGTFNAIAATDWDMANIVTGTGTVLKTGTGLLKVGDDSLKNFTGLTDIRAGTLQIGAYAGDDAEIGGAVRIAAGARMGGTGTIVGNVENTGYVTALNALSAYGSAGDVSTLTVLGTFTNSGVVQLGGTNVGNTLTVNNWVGQGGTLVLHTVLGNDSSPTDRLIINGGSATGSTFVSIVNQNGLGAQTTGDGIMVVQAQNGATTAAGAFALNSRVAAGAYDYALYRGSGSSTDSWYLRTVDDVLPDTGGGGLRPEVPLNAAILPLALDYGYAMLGTLHERVGDDFVQPLVPVYEGRNVWCKDAASNFRCEARAPVTNAESQKWFGGAWARVFADRGINDNGNFYRNGSSYDYTLGGFQSGVDIFGRQSADGSTDKAGLYFGYGQVAGNAKGTAGGTAGSVDLDAYTIGGYWTHKAASGWYTDAVVQGTFYSADARSIVGQQLKPDGYGVIASLEGGYTFKLGNGLTIEPQAQLAYQHVSFDSARDAYGVFSFDDADSLRGRLGVRVAKGWNMGDNAKPRMINAWIRANLWHEFMDSTKATVTTFAGTDPYTVNTALGGTWGEIGAGISGQVSDTTTLFATGAYNRSLDGNDRQSWNGRLGVTVKW